MNNHQKSKIAGVLLLSAVMLLSATAVMANTNSNKITMMSLGAGGTHETSYRDEVIWDNDMTYGEGLLACQYEPTYGELGTDADDFILDTSNDVTGVAWIGGFWNGAPAPFDWQITFHEDDGSGTMPGAVVWGPTTFPNAECNEEFLESSGTSYFYGYSVVLDTPLTCNAGTKYWIAFQGQGVYPPQSGIAFHTDPIALNECKFKSTYFGYPNYVDGYVVFGYSSDIPFQLIGNPPVNDTVPPVTTCTITGTTTKTVTLSATDDNSGVDYTKYKLDAGAWTDYTAAFTVSAVGDHIVYFYSVDKAGNIEEEKNKTFNVPAPITITIKGGLGITATIKNTGTTNLTNVPYTIELDGKLIFVGKAKNDTIATLAAGAEVKVKDFVIGLGKTGIAVTAGGAEASAEGTVILFFVLGVK